VFCVCRGLYGLRWCFVCFRGVGFEFFLVYAGEAGRGAGPFEVVVG
jgi:hypothetical protein